MIARRLFAGLVLALAATAPRAEEARCDALSSPVSVAAAVDGTTDAAAIQAGLRAVFGADRGSLRDGILGPVTLSFLRQLCTMVPLPEATDPVRGTMALAVEYGALGDASPGWPARIAEPEFLPGLAPGGAGRFNAALVRLAGPPEMARIVLDGPPDKAEPCGLLAAEVPVRDTEALAAMQVGVGAILSADPALGPLPDSPSEAELGPETRAAIATVCAAYPVVGGAEAMATALERLGRIEAAVEGGIATLGTEDFAAWLAEAPTSRLRRLLGTPEAVVRLLQDYRASGAPIPEAAPDPVAVAVADCPAPADPGLPVYFALDTADIERLTARAGLEAALAPVAEQRFQDSAALVNAVGAALGVAPPDCAAEVVSAVVERYEDGTVYSLDGTALQALALQPELKDVLPALEPIVGIESASAEQVAASVAAAVRGVIAGTVDAAVDQAADAAAAAAEDVSPAPDTAAPGIPQAAEPAERPQQYAITDTSIMVIEAEVPDEALLAAIKESPYRPVSSRALVRTDMLSALQPVAREQADAASAAALEAVLPGVRAQHRLSEGMVVALAAQPVFAALSPDVIARMNALDGLAYPTERLFGRALASLSPPAEGAARTAILGLARKQVDEPLARRRIAPIAADCGCTADRAEHALVYAFYPFWLLPPATAAEEVGVPRVDFELVERIAFDGLEIDESARLRHAAQWDAAAATFTASAHRHQTAVDIAIRLRGWHEWSANQIADAAYDIVEELQLSRPREEVVTAGGPADWLVRYHDRRADGVTLIAEGYTGEPGTDIEARNLVALVRAVSAGLEGTGQEISLAFDIPLVDGVTERDPLFHDLRELILQTDPLRPVMVERILVFLERPTTKSKKILRARIENAFSGEDRAQVLRNVIPVVPPGANAGLMHERLDGSLTRTASAQAFGQFRDDVVYFQDNFGGIGFWPAPPALGPDGAPDPVGEIVRARFDAWALPASLKPYAGQVDALCTIACPNRLVVYLAVTLAGGAILATGALSFWSSWVRAASSRLLLVPILILVIFGLLAVTATCDAPSRTWAPLAAFVLMTLVAGVFVFHWYERRVDGPMP